MPAVSDEQTPMVKSADRALSVLEYRGWLSAEDSDAGARYRVGPQALAVRASYLRGDDIVRRSSAVLDQLSLNHGETVHLGELNGIEIMYLAKRDARHSLRLVSGVGVRLPAYATALGKMLPAEPDLDAMPSILLRPRQQLPSRTLGQGRPVTGGPRRDARARVCHRRRREH